MVPEYKSAVEKIVHLNWTSLNSEQLKRLMYLSYAAAREFAEALRITVNEYPHDPKLQEMARGELQTDNLRFADYAGTGDHADFLDHFLKLPGFTPDAALQQSAAAYRKICSDIDPKTRAMTIFSREHELSAIFKAILKNEHWDGDILQAFRYYLETHIELDSDEGGHAALVDEYPIDDAVLPFYEARLDLYRVIPELFIVKE